MTDLLYKQPPPRPDGWLRDLTEGMLESMQKAGYSEQEVLEQALYSYTGSFEARCVEWTAK